MERMLRTILALHVDPRQTEGKEMIQHLHKPQNALMHQKTKPIILKTGSFDVVRYFEGRNRTRAF